MSHQDEEDDPIVAGVVDAMEERFAPLVAQLVAAMDERFVRRSEVETLRAEVAELRALVERMTDRT